MKCLLLLVVLLAATGGAMARNEDPELRRAVRHCRGGLCRTVDLGLPTTAKAAYWECMKVRGYVRKD